MSKTFCKGLIENVSMYLLTLSGEDGRAAPIRSWAAPASIELFSELLCLQPAAHILSFNTSPNSCALTLNMPVVPDVSAVFLHWCDFYSSLTRAPSCTHLWINLGSVLGSRVGHRDIYHITQPASIALHISHIFHQTSIAPGIVKQPAYTQYVTKMLHFNCFLL